MGSLNGKMKRNSDSHCCGLNGKAKGTAGHTEPALMIRREKASEAHSLGMRLAGLIENCYVLLWEAPIEWRRIWLRGLKEIRYLS
jgi:hypothetical protein